MVNSPTWIPDGDCHSPVLLDLFLSSDASICSTVAFPSSENSDHVVILVSIDFPSNLKGYVPFHRIVYDYSHADWEGFFDHLKDFPLEDFFEFSAFAAATEFLSGSRLELIHISFIVNISSSLTNPHGFQLLVVLP